MEFDNKKVIDKLQNYFLKQDPKIISRLCGNFAIDLNRFLNIEYLDQDEKYNLIYRTQQNMIMISDFMDGKVDEDDFGLKDGSQ